jgi:hypothetical protein
MKRLAGILMLIALIPVLISCSGTPTLAKNSTELEWYVREGMTLDQVYALMTPELKAGSLIYPAQNIIHQPDGKWKFEPKEGGSPGDTDAPYQVLVISPTSAEEGFYMLFFKDKQLEDDARFDYETGIKIQKLLWTTESTD